MCELRKDQVWGYEGALRSWYGLCVLWWGSDFAFKDGVTISRERGCHQATQAGSVGPRGINLETPLSGFHLTDKGGCMMLSQKQVFGSKTALPTAIEKYDNAHGCTRGSVFPSTVKLDEPSACRAFWKKQASLKAGGCSTAKSTPRYYMKHLKQFGGDGMFM